MAKIGNSPVTTLQFFSVPWDNEYINVVKFSSITQQNSYFVTVEKTMTNCTFQTIENETVIRADIPIDDLLNLKVNYVRYDNGRSGYYYAFIKNIRFASLSSCFVDIELDVYQTFLFDFSVFPSFVEREMIADDTLGNNTVPENLETGKLRVFNSQEKTSITELGILALATRTSGDFTPGSPLYSGIANGLAYFYFPPDYLTYFEQWVQERESEGELEGIKAVIMIPDEFVDYGDQPPVSSSPANWRLPWHWAEACTITQGINGSFSHGGQTAIDFASQGGEKINLYSPTSATVQTVGYDESGLGNYLILSVSGGYTITMGHFDSISITQGSSVNVNTILGVMGTTGNSTGVHVHFDIKQNGASANLTRLFSRPISFFMSSSTTPLYGECGGSNNLIGFYHIVNPSTRSAVTQFNVTKNLSVLSGYTPKNKKLLTYPYNFLIASNNQGGTKEYRYERMIAGDFVVNFSCDVSPNPTLFMYPENYNGNVENYDEGLRLSGLPLVPIQYGAFDSWLAQQGGSSFIQSALSIASLAGGIATGNVAALGVGAAGVLKTAGMWSNAVNQPDTAQGSVSGAGLVGQKKFNVTFFNVGLSREYAEKIDAYFDRYGYQTNEVKYPNMNSNPIWNYVKTQDVNINGDMPSIYLDKLKNIFNNGVTFWKEPDRIGHFELNNHA